MSRGCGASPHPLCLTPGQQHSTSFEHPGCTRRTVASLGMMPAIYDATPSFKVRGKQRPAWSLSERSARFARHDAGGKPLKHGWLRPTPVDAPATAPNGSCSCLQSAQQRQRWSAAWGQAGQGTEGHVHSWLALAALQTTLLRHGAGKMPSMDAARDLDWAALKAAPTTCRSVWPVGMTLYTRRWETVRRDRRGRRTDSPLGDVA
jgi:hypothetical protein